MSLFAMYFKQLHFPHSCLRAVEWSYLCRRSEGVRRSAKLLTVWVYYIRDTKHFFAGNHNPSFLMSLSCVWHFTLNVPKMNEPRWRYRDTSLSVIILFLLLKKTHLIMSSWRISFSRSICSCYDRLYPPPRKLHLRKGDAEITVYSRDDSFREMLEPLGYAIGRGLSDGGNGKRYLQ